MGNLPLEILQWTLALAGVWLISGTLLNFSSHPHWYIRGWDFPRVVTAALALIVAAGWAWICEWQWWDWVFLASLAAVPSGTGDSARSPDRGGLRQRGSLRSRTLPVGARRLGTASPAVQCQLR